MASKRELQKSAMLERARRAVEDFDALRRWPADWKGWVSRRASVTRYWISYAVRSGSLSSPPEGQLLGATLRDRRTNTKPEKKRTSARNQNVRQLTYSIHESAHPPIGLDFPTSSMVECRV
jgi:hypothetical protein